MKKWKILTLSVMSISSIFGVVSCKSSYNSGSAIPAILLINR